MLVLFWGTRHPRGRRWAWGGQGYQSQRQPLCSVPGRHHHRSVAPGVWRGVEAQHRGRSRGQSQGGSHLHCTCCVQGPGLIISPCYRGWGLSSGSPAPNPGPSLFSPTLPFRKLLTGSPWGSAWGPGSGYQHPSPGEPVPLTTGALRSVPDTRRETLLAWALLDGSVFRGQDI